MEGPVRDLRLGLVQRSFAPTRLSNDTLSGIYDRVIQSHRIVAEVTEAQGADPASESSLLVLTGGQHE
jgi:hypothetical protein